MNKKKKIVIPTIVLLAILIVIGGVIAILNTKGWNELHNTVVKDMSINDIVIRLMKQLIIIPMITLRILVKVLITVKDMVVTLNVIMLDLS